MNIYCTSLTCQPTTVSRKYAYPDNLAIMHADGDWQALEGVISKDMATLRNTFLSSQALNLLSLGHCAVDTRHTLKDGHLGIPNPEGFT